MKKVCMPMLNFTLILLAIAVSGCSSTPPAVELDPKVAYKFTGQVCDKSPGANGSCFNGVGVIPSRDRHILEFKMVRSDVMKVRTCNRSRQRLKQGTSFTFKYNPNRLEKNLPDCHIRAEAFDFRKELHSFYWALVQRPGFELPVETQCDGRTIGPDQDAPDGIGACQIAEDMVGLIYFKTKTKSYFNKKSCPLTFSTAKNKEMVIGQSFYIRPKTDGFFICTFLEQVFPFRKALVGIRVYEEEIFPKVDK